VLPCSLWTVTQILEDCAKFFFRAEPQKWSHCTGTRATIWRHIPDNCSHDVNNTRWSIITVCVHYWSCCYILFISLQQHCPVLVHLLPLNCGFLQNINVECGAILSIYRKGLLLLLLLLLLLIPYDQNFDFALSFPIQNSIICLVQDLSL
jgi:hypothetical protein